MSKRPKIDYSQPIQWHDGTPTEVVPNSEWGGVLGVYADPEQMPTGVRFNGHPSRDNEGRPYLRVIKAYGCLADRASGGDAYIENVGCLET